MLNYNNVLKWIDALRSGKYKQGKRRLHIPIDNTFCCLGVLCEVAISEGVDIETKSYREFKMYAKQISTLPLAVLEYIGDNIDPNFWDTLIGMNDKYDRNFSEIADYIERVLLYQKLGVSFDSEVSKIADENKEREECLTTTMP